MSRTLGHTASHRIAPGAGPKGGGVSVSFTACGLVVPERLPAGTIVQRPGIRWPLRRCKHCWKDGPR